MYCTMTHSKCTYCFRHGQVHGHTSSNWANTLLQNTSIMKARHAQIYSVHLNTENGMYKYTGTVHAVAHTKSSLARTHTHTHTHTTLLRECTCTSPQQTEQKKYQAKLKYQIIHVCTQKGTINYIYPHILGAWRSYLLLLILVNASAASLHCTVLPVGYMFNSCHHCYAWTLINIQP